MPEFDFPTAIKELAEATGLCRELHNLMGGRCAVCGEYLSDAPGRIALIPSLRVKCSSLDWSLAFHIVQHDKAEDYPCCQGRNWVPEPDARVACWEIFRKLRGQMRFDMALAALWREVSDEEAVIRAALASLKEQA